MRESRALMSLALLSGLLVAEVLSEGTRSVWGARRDGARRGGLVWGRTSGKGAACWGPGVWPHPSHCRMFSLCRMTPDSGIKGMLLLCPQNTAFSTRMARCVADKTRCSQRSLPPEFESSPEMNVLRSINRRNYRCKFPRPFCASDATLTVCAPNFNLIGNVSCAGTCKEDKDSAFCIATDPTEDTQIDQAVTTTASPATTATPEMQTSTLESTRIHTTTSKFEPPVLNADLVDSAIKITTALGLTPNIQALQNGSSFDASKPKRPESKPSPPAYASPVFDFNSSPEESSYESEQSDEEDAVKPPFSKPVIVQESNLPVTTNKPLGNGEEDSKIFTVELVRPTFDAGVLHQTALEKVPKRPMNGDPSIGINSPSVEPTIEQDGMGTSDFEKKEEEKITNDEENKKKLEAEDEDKKKVEEEILERERFESERLEKERLEKLNREKIEKERLEKERLEKERIEKERLEKERIEKERLEKERIEKERLEKERIEKERLEKERIEKERLEKERMEKERLEKERIEKERLEKERIEKERLEKERIEKERLEKERIEKERLEKERIEKERLEKERIEKERLEKLEKKRLEKLEKERLQKLEKERLEKLEQERLEILEKERLEKLEQERLDELEKKRLENLEQKRLEELEKEKIDKQEKERQEQERIEKDKLKFEKLEKERIDTLEKERIEKEKIEIEKREKERLEKLEKEKLEKLEKEKLEKLEKQKLEKLEKEMLEKLEKERLEKLEKERLEKLEQEQKRLEIERLEKERVEKERLEKERLEKDKLEQERLEKLQNERLEILRIEKEKIAKERLEMERIEKERLKNLEEERLHKEKLEKERLEKLEKERVEKEKIERERLENLKLEKERLEKERFEAEKAEKLEKDRLEEEGLDMVKLEKEKVEEEKLQREKEKQEFEKFINYTMNSHVKDEKEQEDKLKTKNITNVQETMHPYLEDIPTFLSTVCTRPGLLCANHITLVKCSHDLVPIKAWDCSSFFARSATLNAKCDTEKDSCVAIVEDSLLATEDELNQSGKTSPICKKPGSQCVDSATLIHCSNDLRSATVVVCADLFPRYSSEASCDYKLEACVVGLDGDENSHYYEVSHTTSFPDPPLEVLSSSPTTRPTTLPPPNYHPTNPSKTTNAVDSMSDKHSSKRNQSTTEKPLVTSTPPTFPLTDTMTALFPATRNPCRMPGLRCLGGTILEACEKDNPKPVYKMDCSTVLANSLDARCEEHTSGEASCMVELLRSSSQFKFGQKYDHPLREEDVFTLELSVIDVTRTFDQSDSEIPSWNCTRSGQYCADDSTLLSCNSDFSLEFALACGAIAPESVVAFCDSRKDACVVKKITDLITNSQGEDVNSESKNSSKGGITENTNMNVSSVINSIQNATNEQQTQNISFENIPNYPEWDFSTISQLYPPDVPLNAYGGNIKQGENSTLQGDINNPENSQYSSEITDPLTPGYLNKCTKPGPICLDISHLGSCSDDLELQYVLPCSALYKGDSNSICNSQLSACLPSSAKITTTTSPPTTTTPIATTTTTTTTARPKPTIPSNVFIPQQIPPYTQYQYHSPINNIPRPPQIQENQFNNFNQFPTQQSAINSYQRPALFQFFQRPITNNLPIQQPARPSFFQNLLQNYGIRLPSAPQSVRPTLFGSQNTRPTLGPFPILSSIFQTATSPNPTQIQNKPPIPEDYGQEPYDFNDPQYVHPEGQGSNPYHRVSSQTANPLNISPSINPTFYEEILKYMNRGQQAIQNTQSAIHESEQDESILGNLDGTYFYRFLAYLAQKSPENESKFSSSSRPYRPQGTHNRPDFAETDKTAPQTGSNFQPHSGMSNANPTIWVDKVQFDGFKQGICRRPGMQCIDDNSLGACSSELVLQYTIPCRNLLPFVTIGKAFCDEKNDACAVMVAEDPSEYPMDYSSYP